MNHEDVQRLLSDYLEGELPPETKRAVEEHLATCAECRETRDDLSRLLSAVSSLTPKKAPDGFALAVQRRMRRQARRKRLATSDRLRHKVPYETVALLMLMVVLAIFIMIVYLRTLDVTIESQGSNVRPEPPPRKAVPQEPRPDTRAPMKPQKRARP